MKKEKSMIAICLSLVFMLSSVLGQIPVPVRADATDYGISSPRTDNGVTTWDCIYFGNYFQNIVQYCQKKCFIIYCICVIF